MVSKRSRIKGAGGKKCKNDRWERYAWANLVPGRLEVPVSMGTPMKAASRPSAVSWYGNLAMVAIPDTRATNSLLGGTLYVLPDIILLGVAFRFPFPIPIPLTPTSWPRMNATHDLSSRISLMFMNWSKAALCMHERFPVFRDPVLQVLHLGTLRTFCFQTELNFCTPAIRSQDERGVSSPWCSWEMYFIHPGNAPILHIFTWRNMIWSVCVLEHSLYSLIPGVRWPDLLFSHISLFFSITLPWAVFFPHSYLYIIILFLIH